MGLCYFSVFFFFFSSKNCWWVGFGVAPRVNEWQWLGGGKINRKRSSVRSFWWYFGDDWSIIERDMMTYGTLFFLLFSSYFFLKKKYKWVWFVVSLRANEWQWLGGSGTGVLRSSARSFWW
jgi:hypothetical protein